MGKLPLTKSNNKFTGGANIRRVALDNLFESAGMKQANKPIDYINDCRSELYKVIEEAVKKDMQDNDIIFLMNEKVKSYLDKNINPADYENALESYAKNMNLEEKRKTYPSIQSIGMSFLITMKTSIRNYGERWIDDKRIGLLKNHNLFNANVTKAIQCSNSLDKILDILIIQNPHVENMPNLKNALIKIINSKIEEIEAQKQNGEHK